MEYIDLYLKMLALYLPGGLCVLSWFALRWCEQTLIHRRQIKLKQMDMELELKRLESQHSKHLERPP